MKLSSVSLAILPLLSVFPVYSALYSITEIGDDNGVKYTYATALNDNGDVLFNGAGLYNFPIDLDAIDFESTIITALLTEEQIQAAQNGNIDATVRTLLLTYLEAYSSTTTIQKIASSYAFWKTANADPVQIPLRDVNASRSNSEYLYAVNNQGIAVGWASAPYTKQAFTAAPTDDVPDPVEQDLFVPEAMHQAGVIVQNNQVGLIPAPYTEYGGGYTVAKAISDSGWIAGHGSTDMLEASKETAEANCLGESSPLQICYSLYSGSYTQRAMVWQLQNDGSVSEPQVYGFLGDKNTGEEHSREEYGTLTYYSTANAVNDNGIGAGLSLYSDSDRLVRTTSDGYYYYDVVFRAEHATLYAEGEMQPLVDADEWSSSNALAINNNDIITGYAVKTINSASRSKFFYYDYNLQQIVFPDDFFTSSSSIANDINDQNQIVGRAEVMLASTTSRRLHAFLYDIASDTFSDLNDLVGCNNNDYLLVEAKSINNNGEILATAVVKRDALDAEGESVIGTDGTAVQEERTVTVLLQPVAGGSVDDCGETDGTEYSRKGGTTNGFLLFLLTVAGWLRWYKRK